MHFRATGGHSQPIQHVGLNLQGKSDGKFQVLRFDMVLRLGEQADELAHGHGQNKFAKATQTQRPPSHSNLICPNQK